MANRGASWRFSFGITTEVSSVLPVMLCPSRRPSACRLCLPLPRSSLPYFADAIMSIIWWTAGADCSRSVCLGFDQRAYQSLSRSSSSQRMCSQALLSVSNSRANAPAVSPGLIALFASGVVTCLAWRSAPVLLSQPQSSLSPNPPLAIGHTGVAQ